MSPEPLASTPTGSHAVVAEACCALDPQIVCPASREVASRSWVLTTIGAVVFAVASAFVLTGSVVFAQAADAGGAGVVAAAHVDARVDALVKVVAENQRISQQEAADVRADIRALSMQMATGFQAPRLRASIADGGAP